MNPRRLLDRLALRLRVQLAKRILFCHRAIVFDAPEPLFDGTWYARRYPDIARAGIDPLTHYLGFGAAEGRDPSPHLDSIGYATTYLSKSWVLDPLTHYVAIGRRRGWRVRASQGPTWRTHGPSPVAMEQTADLLAALAVVEPELAQLQAIDLTDLSIVAPAAGRRERAWLALYRSLPAAPRRVVIVGGLQDPAPPLLQVLDAIGGQGELDETLLLAADEAERPVPTWLPRGVLWRSFADLGEDLNDDDRVQLVTTVVHSLQPASVLLVDSAAARRAWDRFGAALSQLSAVYVCVAGLDDLAAPAPDASDANLPAVLRAYVCPDFGRARDAGGRWRLRAASSVDLPLSATTSPAGWLATLSAEPGFLAAIQPVRGRS